MGRSSHPDVTLTARLRSVAGWARWEAVGWLLVAVRPVASFRAARDPDLRRAFPFLQAVTARRLVATAVVLALAALVDLRLLLAALIVLGAVAAGLRWRARPAWGRRRGWPPGRVTVGVDSIVDPDHYAAQAARYGPVFKTNHLLQPQVGVCGMAAVTELLGAHRDDLGPVPAPFDRHVPGGLFRWREGTAGAAARLTFARALSTRFVDAAEPVLRSSAADGCRRLVGAGPAAAPLPVVRELVADAWTTLLLGIGPDDPARADVRSWCADLAVYRPDPLGDADVEDRLDRLAAAIRSAADHAAGRPSLPVELRTKDPAALDDPGTVRNLIYTTITTGEDVAGLLMWLVKHLGDDPRWVGRLRDDPDDLADRIVAETLRLEQSEYLFRRIRRDLPFRGFVLPAGWLLRACIHESHRDPAVFPDPDRFDPDRFADRSFGRDEYAPFGLDPRPCTGQGLARRMARVFVTELCVGFDWEVVADGTRELSAHRHWAPSSDLRIAVRPRG